MSGETVALAPRDSGPWLFVVSADWSRTVGENHLSDALPAFGGALWARVASPASRALRAGQSRYSRVVWVDRLAVAPGGRPIALQHRPEIVNGSTIVEPIVEGDLVVTQRLMHPRFGELYSELVRSGVRVVADVDDHFWRLDPRNNAYRATDPALNPESNRDTYAKTLRLVDRVVVSTPYLADEVARIIGHRDVVVVENAVDLDLVGDPNTHPGDERPTLGWAGSMNHRSGDLDQLIGVGLDRLDPAIPFVHLGSTPLAAAAEYLTWAKVLGPDRSITQRPLAPIHRHLGSLAEIDVGIAPLSDVAFNRAKSAIKVLEYAAAGVVAVASTGDAYRAVVDVEPDLATLVRRRGDWRRAVGRVVALSPAERRDRARAARAAVERRWSIADRYVDFLAAWVG